MNKRTFGYISIVLSAVIFSTMEVVLKTVTGVFKPLQIVCLRFFIGGLCLVPFAAAALKKKKRRLKLSDLPFFIAMGLLCVVLSMVCYQLAVTYSPASTVAVVFSCNALFTTLFAGLILKEPLKLNHYLALVLEVAAVICIMDPFHQSADRRGILFALAAAVLFALYGVAGRKKSAEFGGIAITCGSVFTGSVILMLLIFIGRIPAVSAALEKAGLSLFSNVPLFSGIPASAIPAFLYICVVVSAGGYVFHMLAVENTSAREAALIFFIKPMIAPIIALIFLQEEIKANTWIGIALFLIGSAIATIPGVLAQRKK